MGLLLFVLPYIFSFSPDFLSKISLQPFKIETSNLVYRFTTTSCIVELKMPFSYLFFPIFVLFSFSPDFSSKISSNLVHRFTTTSCIVELKMGLLLFVLPYICFIFSFSPDFSSEISLQPFKIETSDLVYRFTTTSCDVKIPAICFGSAKAGV